MIDMRLDEIREVLEATKPSDWVAGWEQPEIGEAREAAVYGWRFLVVYGGLLQIGTAVLPAAGLVVNLPPDLCSLARQKAAS